MTSERQPTAEQEHFISKRIIVKIGSSTITEGATNQEPLNLNHIDEVAGQCSILFKNGVEVLIVSSGSVACGRQLLGITDDDISDKQVEATYGQPTLIGTWIEAFKMHGVMAGQVLLTENDLEEASTVLRKAMKLGIVIINANDAVSKTEMEQLTISADNDLLAEYVALAVEADTLLILTDVDGVLGNDKRLIKDGHSIGDDFVFWDKSKDGTGGMKSKVEVLQNVSANNRIRGAIASIKKRDIILQVARGNTKSLCTAFTTE